MLMILTFVSGIHLYQIAMRREYALKERSLLAEDQCVMVIVLEFLDLEMIFPNDTLSCEEPIPSFFCLWKEHGLDWLVILIELVVNVG